MGAVIVVYSGLFGSGELSLDDRIHIFANPFFLIHKLQDLWIKPNFGMYIPVSYTVWGAIYNFFDAAVLPFRVLNVSIHIANTFLVYFILKSFFVRENKIPAIFAAFGASLFALHPVQVETVAWLSCGRDLMAAFFAFLSIIFYFYFIDRKWRWCGFVLFILALLSKPNVASLPLVILSYFLLFDKGKSRKVFFEMIWWLLPAIIIAFFTSQFQEPTFHQKTEFWQKPIVMMYSYGFYIFKLIFPEGLSADYGKSPDYIFEHWSETIFYVAIFIALIVSFFKIQHKHDRRFRIGMTWFFMLLPTSGIIYFGFQDISTVADHYLYFSMIIPAVVFSLLLYRRQGVIPVLAAVCLLLIYFNYDLKIISVWRNDRNFFENVLKNNSDSFTANIGMGLEQCKNKEDLNTSLRFLEKGRSVEPNNPLGFATVISCLSIHQSWQIIPPFEKEFQNNELARRLELNEILAAEVFSSFASAYWVQGNQQKAFFYMCQSFWRNGIEPNINAKFKYILQNLGKSSETDCPKRIGTQMFSSVQFNAQQ